MAATPPTPPATSELTLGYWKIRGLAAAARMMLFKTKTAFTDKGYGADAGEKWFGGEKNTLKARNAAINLPYVIDGDTVVTQSNSVLLYLGQKTGMDRFGWFFHNHQVLDQTMDLRNDTMKIVYPFNGTCKTKEEFPACLKKHMEGASTHLTKLEGLCKGPYMCGDAPQSGDFHVFEMIDQHKKMCDETEGVEFSFDNLPKLKALYEAFLADTDLKPYFEADCYTAYALNNPGYTHFNGSQFNGEFGDTVATVRAF